MINVKQITVAKFELTKNIFYLKFVLNLPAYTSGWAGLINEINKLELNVIIII